MHQTNADDEWMHAYAIFEILGCYKYHDKVVVEPILHVLRDWYWTFGVVVGNLLEPTLCHRKVCVLDVGSDFLWFTCIRWKMSPLIWVKFSCFLGNHLKLVMYVWSILEMVGCHLHFLEGSSMHTKPLTNLLKDEKKFSNFIVLFGVSQLGLSWLSLQEVHDGSIALLQSRPHGYRKLGRLLELDTEVHFLRI